MQLLVVVVVIRLKILLPLKMIMLLHHLCHLMMIVLLVEVLTPVDRRTINKEGRRIMMRGKIKMMTKIMIELVSKLIHM